MLAIVQQTRHVEVEGPGARIGIVDGQRELRRQVGRRARVDGEGQQTRVERRQRCADERPGHVGGHRILRTETLLKIKKKQGQTSQFFLV